ncbi:MAG: hypothetical protein QNK29_12450 [Desulfobacterales bacterium]|nr:hypothetical protein [Desulfobacterales bacterium]
MNQAGTIYADSWLEREYYSFLHQHYSRVTTDSAPVIVVAIVVVVVIEGIATFGHEK